MSKANGNFCCPGDTRFFLLCLPLPFSTNRFSILEPQWHLEPGARTSDSVPQPLRTALTRTRRSLRPTETTGVLRRRRHLPLQLLVLSQDDGDGHQKLNSSKAETAYYSAHQQ